MGNWLKGRVLVIPDNGQQSEQVATNTSQNYQLSTTSTPRQSILTLLKSPSTYNPPEPQINQPTCTQQTPTQSNSQQPDLSSRPIYYPPYSSSLLQFATEEEQIQLAKRIGLIQHLPTGTYDTGGSSTKNLRECVICMVEFSKGDSIRFLPCLHTYHVHCIDDWLMRSFICPSCMEPVDVALLNTL